MTKNLKEVCHLDNNPLIQTLSSLNVLSSRVLATAVRNVGISQWVGGGASKKRCELCPS